MQLPLFLPDVLPSRIICHQSHPNKAALNLTGIPKELPCTNALTHQTYCKRHKEPTIYVWEIPVLYLKTGKKGCQIIKLSTIAMPKCKSKVGCLFFAV